jgi:hypothetical protein
VYGVECRAYSTGAQLPSYLMTQLPDKPKMFRVYG